MHAYKYMQQTSRYRKRVHNVNYSEHVEIFTGIHPYRYTSDTYERAIRRCVETYRTRYDRA